MLLSHRNLASQRNMKESSLFCLPAQSSGSKGLFYPSCVCRETSPGNTPSACTILKHTTTSKRFKNTISKITDHGWSNSKKLSEKSDKFSECANNAATPSPKPTNPKPASYKHTIRLGKEDDMEKWRVPGRLDIELYDAWVSCVFTSFCVQNLRTVLSLGSGNFSSA